MKPISFKSIKKSYDGNNYVVKDLNLDIKSGEFVTMLGPSGSGKTTCLMMLAGFESVTDGQILVSGQPIQDIVPNKRNIGMVFQSYALFPHMTVAQNLAYPLKIRKKSTAEQTKRVDEYLSLVEMTEFGSRYPGQLSGGQKQRVALARALIFNPDIVLMDEPLGALDKNLREQMQYEIVRLHKKFGFTVVYVTHDQQEALTMSDRIAVFDDGVIQQYDPAETVYNSPKNAFVANFIGENNNMDAVLTGEPDAVGKCIDVALCNGVQIQARLTNTQLNAEVRVSVRPESLFILKNKVGADVSSLAGVIREKIYLGSYCRCIVRTDVGDIVMKLSTEDGAKYFTTNSVEIAWQNSNGVITNRE